MSEPQSQTWRQALAASLLILAVMAGPARAADPLPSLLVDESAPLLLDETPAEPARSSDPNHPAADNNRCFVCHANFKEEPFVQWHAKANVGCVRCHGDSADHVADEANLTPPAVMFWPSRVGFNCYGCHPQHKASARDVIVCWQERIAGKVDPRRVVCTDCHGSHRLKLRTIVWNKRTSALVSKVRPAATNAPLHSPSPAAAGPRPEGSLAVEPSKPSVTSH